MWSAGACSRRLPPGLARACSSHQPGNANLPIAAFGFQCSSPRPHGVRVFAWRKVRASALTKITTRAKARRICAVSLAACTRIPALKAPTYNHRFRQPKRTHPPPQSPRRLKGREFTAVTNDETQRDGGRAGLPCPERSRREPCHKNDGAKRLPLRIFSRSMYSHSRTRRHHVQTTVSVRRRELTLHQPPEPIP
jgi:hypothetical protein